MPKDTVLEVSALITTQDITAYYEDNPILEPSKAAIAFPLVKNTEKTWKTLSNKTQPLNVAAEPISTKSPVPVSGRKGFKTIIGDMAEFGKGREMTADDIERFEKLKRDFAQFKNPAAAKELIDFYGNDLKFCRDAMLAEMSFLSWQLIANACNISFLATHSPYLVGLAAMDYAVQSWQKEDVTTSWADDSALILDDIQNWIDLAETKGKILRTLTINKKWFTYVRKNTQVQKYCATLVQNLYNTQAPPTLEAINSMLDTYFNFPVRFEVIDEYMTRESVDGVETTLNPFSDARLVLSVSNILGHFEWNPLPIVDPTREVYEQFFVAGNYKQIDPSYSKIYTKGRGFPVVDTYADNIYVKIDATSW